MTVHCLTTNPQPQNDRLAALLSEQGCTVTQLPLHRYGPPRGGLCVSAEQLRTHNVFIVCTAQSVRVLAERGLLSELQGQICAVGSATAAALSEQGVQVNHVGRQGAAELIEHLCEHNVLGPEASVLSLQAEDGNTYWHAAVRAAGAKLTMLPTHRLCAEEIDAAVWLATQGFFDAVAFTAPSAAQRFVELFGGDSLPDNFHSAKFFPIGKMTRQKAENLGVAVQNPPSEPDFALFAQRIANSS